MSPSVAGTVVSVDANKITVKDGQGFWRTIDLSGSTTYTYAAGPTAPGKPSVTAGISSATLTWVAPASNGSAITSYVVTPYKATVAQTPITFDATAVSRVITGLTPGSSRRIFVPGRR